MEIPQLKSIIQAALLAAGRPVKIPDLLELFEEHEQVTTALIRSVINELQAETSTQCFDLKEVASGFVYQIKNGYAQWLSRLWEEKAPRYSRAFLETLVIIAYRQPVTRGEIEEIRGVAVNSAIIKTLLERDWIKVIGHRDLPGKPAIFGTTQAFLDYFNLKSLADLPTLSEIRNIDKVVEQLEMPLTLSPSLGSDQQITLSDDFSLQDEIEYLGSEETEVMN